MEALTCTRPYITNRRLGRPKVLFFKYPMPPIRHLNQATRALFCKQAYPVYSVPCNLDTQFLQVPSHFDAVDATTYFV